MSVPEDVTDEDPLKDIIYIGWYPEAKTIKFRTRHGDKITFTHNGYIIGRGSFFTEQQVQDLLSYSNILFDKNE